MQRLDIDIVAMDMAFGVLTLFFEAQKIDPTDIKLSYEEIKLIYKEFSDKKERVAATALVKELKRACDNERV